MKYALVTGAGRGLGLGFAQALAAKGYTVFAGVRDTAVFPVTDEHIIPVALHVDDDASIQKAAAFIAQQGAHISLLINNAGVSKRSASVGGSERVCQLDKLSREALLHMFNVNAVSALMVAQAIVPLMTEEDSFIINISSGRASFDQEFSNDSPNANYGYRASKAALNMFTLASQRDLPDNIQTFSVHPGLVVSDMNPDGDTQPVDAANQILAIADTWATAKNGAFLNTDGVPFSR